MKRTFHYRITEADENCTIEHYLKRREYSRHIIVQLKKTKEGILRNGTWAKTSDKLSAGDTLAVCLIENESSPNIVPVRLPLDIVYEDEDILVLNKPSDMPIHPSQNNYDNTLANALAWYYKQQDMPFVYRCINRLDRNTTGLLIVAKHMLSSAILSGMMLERKIHREYLAVTTGRPPEKGTVTAPIGRLPGSTIERFIDEENGEYACTHYRTITETADYALVSLKLETGRTHQIRVHMRHIGHPLAGDTLYNPDDEQKIRRQALHSHRLTFIHPITKTPMQFTAPVPSDMQELVPLPESLSS